MSKRGVWGIVLALLTVLFLPSPASAYWEYGHETVAAIAWSQIEPSTRAEIRQLLRYAPELATPTCPVRNIEDASVWPDCIKKLGDRFSYTFAWHYQDVDICKPFDLKSPCAGGNCLSAQITRNEKLLADKSLPPRERLMALAFLVHFMGDLHQPLHAGEHNDAGANKVGANYGIAEGRINLHSIWDGYLAERAISTPPAGAEGLLSQVPVAERPAIRAGTVEDWSRESWQIARDKVYAPLFGDPCKSHSDARVTLDEAKIEAAIPVVREEVVRGGLRLARVLDEVLGPKAPS